MIYKPLLIGKKLNSVFFFVISRNDSVVSERINFDLMTKVKDIQEGTCSCPELFGSLNIIPTDSS